MYALLAKSLQQGKRDGIASAFEMRPFKRSSASDRRVATARIDLMTKQLFMIITEAPSAEEEAAFETWYVDRHMPDVLAVPGFTAAQRFRLAPGPDEDNAPARFLTIYEMETDDRTAVMAEVRRRAGTPKMPLYPGERKSPAATMFAEAVTARMAAPERE